MTAAQATPFSIPPAVMAELCKHLYQLNPDYTAIQPSLFSSYLPNLLPKMTEEDLAAQREADRVLQVYRGLLNAKSSLIYLIYFVCRKPCEQLDGVAGRGRGLGGRGSGTWRRAGRAGAGHSPLGDNLLLCCAGRDSTSDPAV